MLFVIHFKAKQCENDSLMVQHCQSFISATRRTRYAALDGMVDVLARKLRKYKERRNERAHGNGGVSPLRTPMEELDEPIDDNEDKAEANDFAFFEAEAEAFAVEITKVKRLISIIFYSSLFLVVVTR